MNQKRCNNVLSNAVVKKLILDAEQKLIECSKYDNIIGKQIFDLLSLYSRVLYYPLDDDNVWGFLERVQGKMFVCINTSIPYDKQVFVAAHELYHIWFNDTNVQELILSSNLEEKNMEEITVNELMANRFAAEFLARTDLLKKEMIRYSINAKKITIKDVLILCDVFTLPYKTMVRRLDEIQMINTDEYNVLMSTSNDEICKWRTILGITLPDRKNYIRLHNLIEISVSLYNRDLISFEKLQYLLSFSELTPQDVGVVSEETFTFTETEISSIMEGEDG